MSEGAGQAETGRIVRVRLFLDRAAITRRVERPYASGEDFVELGLLPLRIDPATVRASVGLVSGGAEVPLRVTGLTTSAAAAPVEEGPRRALRAEREAVEAQLEALEDEDATEARADLLLTRYAELASAKLSLEWLDAAPSFDRWGAIFDHLRRSRSALVAGQSRRRSERGRLEARRAELLEEEARLREPDALGWRLRVTFAPPEAREGTLAVEVTYLSDEARWSPCYDARHVAADIARDGRHEEYVALTGIALVTQRTGEDWSDVELIATTSRPPLSMPPPKLGKLVVRGHPGGPIREVTSTTRPDERLTGASEGAGAQARATVEHAAPGRVTVPSTGRPVRVELFQLELPARSRLEVAPVDRPVALQVADTENRSPRVLIPGPVSLFRGPNYAGQAQLGFIGPGERFRLPLGTDASLRITRVVKSEPEKVNPLTGSLSYDFAVETTLENLSREPVEVVVRDRVPISHADDTSVKLTKLDRASELDEETGRVSLRVAVPPHSRRAVQLGFRVTAVRSLRLVPPPVV